jgi:hypothetical protein
LLGGHVDLRLVVKNEVPVLDRSSKLGDEAESGGAVIVTIGFVDLVPATRGFGVVHRHVGPLHQGVDIVAVVREERESDACIDLDLQAFQQEGLAKSGADLVRNCHRVRGRGKSMQEHGEFVAAQASHRVAAAQCALEASCCLLEEVIPGVVAQRVVDVFEAVQVHQHDPAHRLVPLCAQERLGHAVAEQDAVRQGREAVVQSLVFVLSGLTLQLLGRRRHQSDQDDVQET